MLSKSSESGASAASTIGLMRRIGWSARDERVRRDRKHDRPVLSTVPGYPLRSPSRSCERHRSPLRHRPSRDHVDFVPRLLLLVLVAGLLERFLPRFNARFAVAARQREPAWRPLDSTLDLGAVLAFRHTRTVARDNTVKYHWRTLQLLPSPQRPSYAGARVEVLERPGGELAVRHQGETIASRLAPPRAGVLRERRSELALDPALERIASGLGPSGGPPRPQAHPATTNGTIVNAAAPTVLRSPTASQAARWKAIQQALLQGLSMRATARLLGISRNTIRRYVRAGGPPGRQGAASSTSSDHPGGHFR